MEQQQVNNKRIAKNTIVLYLRSLVVLGISLYTSRVILSALGIEDYGTYTLVGGIVYLLNFLNNALGSATSRFITYELGRGNNEKLKEIFATTITIHFILALIILIFSETVGLYIVNYTLNIPEDRMFAANWVYQLTLLTFFIGIMCVPYSATIGAHEHFSATAYFAIVEVVMKLIIVIVLPISPIDRLIMYGIYVMLVQLLMRFLYNWYCIKHFEEARWRLFLKKDQFKQMFSYISWSLFGNLAGAIELNLKGILCNLFYGVGLNAATSVAGRVNSVVMSFVSSFSSSINPQITKTYASENYEGSARLVYRGARFSFYIMMIMAVAVIINIDYVLHLWLEEVPEYTAMFVCFTLVSMTLRSMTGPITTAINATGKIMKLQLSAVISVLIGVPFTYIILDLGYPPYYIQIPAICLASVWLFYQLYILKQLVPIYSLRYFFFNVFLRCTAIFAGCLAIVYYIRSFFEDSFLTLIITSIISIVICGVAVAFLGMTKHERVVITTKAISMVKSRLHIG